MEKEKENPEINRPDKTPLEVPEIKEKEMPDEMHKEPEKGTEKIKDKNKKK